MLDFLAGRLTDPWWREPILLLAGHQATHAARSARELLRALAVAGEDADARFAAAELAATAASEWRESGEPLRADCARRIVALLEDADALAGARAVLRARTGDRLSQLGDPRFDPQRFFLPADDMLGFVRIAADPDFVIGTRSVDRERVARIARGKVYDDEINELPTPTREFHIARYPVTVAQFSARSALCHSGISDSGGGAGETSPAARSAGSAAAPAGSDGPRRSVVVAKLRDQEIFTVDTVHHAVLVGDPT